MINRIKKQESHIKEDGRVPYASILIHKTTGRIYYSGGTYAELPRGWMRVRGVDGLRDTYVLGCNVYTTGMSIEEFVKTYGLPYPKLKRKQMKRLLEPTDALVDSTGAEVQKLI